MRSLPKDCFVATVHFVAGRGRRNQAGSLWANRPNRQPRVSCRCSLREAQSNSVQLSGVRQPGQLDRPRDSQPQVDLQHHSPEFLGSLLVGPWEQFPEPPVAAFRKGSKCLHSSPASPSSGGDCQGLALSDCRCFRWGNVGVGSEDAEECEGPSLIPPPLIHRRRGSS